MRKKQTRLAAVLLTGCVFGAPAVADVIGEGVSTVRCTEATDITLPKKMEFVQMVRSDHFSMLGKVALVVTASYDEDPASNGKIIATAYQITPDTTEIKLGKAVAKFKDGEAEKTKIVDAMIEAGDQIRWQVKLKRLPDLKASLDDCWSFGPSIFVADEVPN